MNKINLNIIAGILALIAVVGLVKGQVILFLGLLMLSGMIIGVNRAVRLITIEGDIDYIKKSNRRLAFLGVIFALLSHSGIGTVDILAGFAFGVCFGLIAVNFIFEKSRE